MKKKIILLAAALMLIATGVSASSLNGDYKGNPIVVVKSDGKALESEEVPAMIYDGHTVVPISLLRQLGASVVWNAESYSVEVSLPKETVTTNTGENVKTVSKEAWNLGAKYFKLVYDSLGSYVEIDYNLTGNDLTTMSNIALLALKTDTTELWINEYSNGVKVEFAKVSRKDIENFSKGAISQKDFIDTWKFTDLTGKSSTPTQNNTQPVIIPDVTPSVIESKIDGTFEGWTGDTIFKLSNGQIWQQASYAYTYHYAYSPKVTIYKDGSVYKMMVDGVDSKISVTRIK